MDDTPLDALLGRSPDQSGGLRLTDEGSMLGDLVRAVLERALEFELTGHLGYEKGGRGGAGRNARNGAIAKTVQTGIGPVPVDGRSTQIAMRYRPSTWRVVHLPRP